MKIANVNEMHEVPRYRVTAKTGAMLLGGILLPQHSVTEWNGWPTMALEPINTPAHRIFKFWERNHSDPTVCGRYVNPTSQITGTIRLASNAALGTRERDPHKSISFPRIPSIPKPAEMFPGMPVYRLLDEECAWYGGEIVERGTEVIFLGWPPERLLDPANKPAELVLEYFLANAAHPRFEEIRAPWDEFTRSVVLPNLPAVRRPAYAMR